MSAGERPSHRLLLVRDRANKDEKGVFLELGPLWPSKGGFSGPIRDFPVNITLISGGKYRFIIAENQYDDPKPEEPSEPYSGQFDE
jgi:hypothetical protein